MSEMHNEMMGRVFRSQDMWMVELGDGRVLPVYHEGPLCMHPLHRGRDENARVLVRLLHPQFRHLEIRAEFAAFID